MGVELWHWNRSPIIPMEASRRLKTEKTRQVRSNVNVLFRLQWRGASWNLPKGRTFNQELHEAIYQKPTKLWKNQS